MKTTNNNTTKTEYDIQAENFVEGTGIEISKTYTGHRLYFEGDKQRRSCWHISVSREGRFFSYDFGQSIADSYKKIRNWGDAEIKKAPSDYDLLACMSSDSHQADSFGDWCSDFGYNEDSRHALNLYLKCEKISSDINRFFTSEELEQLREIC